MIVRERWGIELTHAWQTTEDQIVPAPQPAYTGYSSQWVNAGTIKGHTTELTVEGQLFQRANMGWTTLLTSDYSYSVIDEWPLPCDTSRTWRFDCPGEPVYGIYGFRLLTGIDQLGRHRNGEAVAFANQFQVNDEGYVVWVGDKNYTDGMVNGVVTPGTWGTTSPTIGSRTYLWGIPFFEEGANLATLRPSLGTGQSVGLGWINNLRYGSFNFHAHLHASLGGVVNNRAFQDMITNASRNAPMMDQGSKPDGLKKPINYYIQAVGSGGSNYITEKGDYLKLRTLSVSVQLNQNQIQTIGLQNLGVRSLQVGLIGRNIFTITPYTGFDPEQALDLNSRLNAVGTGTYPGTRTLTAEIAVTF